MSPGTTLATTGRSGGHEFMRSRDDRSRGTAKATLAEMAAALVRGLQKHYPNGKQTLTPVAASPPPSTTRSRACRPSWTTVAPS
jgi:hypothetical protein